MERQVSRNRESQPVPLACDTESALCQDLQGIHTDTEAWDIMVKAKTWTANGAAVCRHQSDPKPAGQNKATQPYIQWTNSCHFLIEKCGFWISNCCRSFCPISHLGILAITKISFSQNSRVPERGLKWIKCFSLHNNENQENGGNKPPTEFGLLLKKITWLLLYIQTATSFINTGKHQEVCHIFHKLKYG